MMNQNRSRCLWTYEVKSDNAVGFEKAALDADNIQDGKVEME